MTEFLNSPATNNYLPAAPFFLPKSQLREERRREGEQQPAMAPPPGPYTGNSTLALVARASAFSFGLVCGSMKLKYLKAKEKSQRKAEAKAHH